jgi:hypothetical protein
MKIRLVGAELFHVDGQTDGLTERGPDRQTDGYEGTLIISFRNFAKAHGIDKEPHEMLRKTLPIYRQISGN